LATLICEQLAEGQSLRKICEQEGFPGKTTVFRWLEDDELKAFRDQYARARARQAETMLDEIIEIADDSSRDLKQVEIAPGVTAQQVDNEVVNRSRLRVEARKWAMSKLAPKKYGDKLDLTSDGEKISTGPRVFQILPASQRPVGSDGNDEEVSP
jgi:hypothetical protein